MRATQIATQYRRYYVSLSWRDKQARFSRHLAISFRPTTYSQSRHTGPFLWTRPNAIVAGVSRLSPFATPTFLFPVTIPFPPSFFLLRLTLLYASHVGVIVQEATLPFAVSVLLGYNTHSLSLSLSLLHSFGSGGEIEKKICIGINSWADRYARTASRGRRLHDHFFFESI